MTNRQLQKGIARVGPSFLLPKKGEAFRQELSRFMSAVLNERMTEPLSARSAEAYRRTYKEDPPDDNRIKKMWRESADEHERAIWDMQTKAGCPIPGQEQVARDAIREGKPQALVDKIRGKRRPIIK